MRIGNQTANSAPDPFAPFELAIGHGFDAFEWFDDRDADDSTGFAFSLLDDAGRAALRDRGQAAGVRFSVHAHWRADLLTDKGQSRLGEAIDFATAIDAPVVVCHLNAGQRVSTLMESLELVLRQAAAADVCLALENTPATSPAQFNALFERLQQHTQCRHYAGMCFDMGHANLHPATRNDYIGYFDQLGPHVPIRHVHVHENCGDADTHVTIGAGPSKDNPTGVRSLLTRLHRRGYEGALIMEQWPEPATRLGEARQWLAARLAEAREAS